MQKRRRLTDYNLSGFFKKVKCQVRHLSKPYYFVKSFHDHDSWSFINWRFRVVQGLRDYLGHFPDILAKQGKLKVWGSPLTRFPCNNSPDRSFESFEPNAGVRKKGPKLSLQERLERAERRVEYSKRCGTKGAVAVLENKITSDKFVAYLPIHCHSVFCPRCSQEWGREVKNRIMSVFENADEVYFITLTIENRECQTFEEVYQAIDDIMSYLTKLYSLKITDNFLSKLDNAFREECRSYYENAVKKVGRKQARKSVANQVKHYRRAVSVLRSFRGYKLGQVVNAVWRLEVKSKVEGDKLVLHPHFHGLTTSPVPKLMWQSLWGMVVGSPVITDARVVKGQEAVSSYVSEYESKPEELPSGRGFLSLEEARIWIEGALYNRQRIRVWGFSAVRIETPEEVKPYRVAFAYYLTAYLNLEHPLPDRLSCWLKCRNEGIERFFITRGSVRDFRFSSEMFYEIFLYYDIHRGFVIEGIPESALPASGSGSMCGVNLDFDE